MVSQSLAVHQMPLNIDPHFNPSFYNSITPSGRAGKRLNQGMVQNSMPNPPSIVVEDPLNSAQHLATQLVSYPASTTAKSSAAQEDQFFHRRNNAHLSQSIDPAAYNQLKQSGHAFFSPQPERQSYNIQSDSTLLQPPLMSHAIRAEKLEKE